MKPLASIALNIKGRSWNFILLTDRAFNKLHNPNDEGNAAMTVFTKYEVHFAKTDWSLVDIRHELGHCYYAMSQVGSSELTPSQVEETMCSIFGAHGPEMSLIADRIAECFFNYNK